MANVDWQRNVPQAIVEHDTLDRVDYADLFTGTASEPLDLTPHTWARAMGRSAPLRVRLTVRAATFVQRRVLGLHLARKPGPNDVFGWRLAEVGDHWFRLEAEGWLGEGHLVFHVTGNRVCIGTLLRYDRRMAAIVWSPVSRLHRQVGLTLLRYLVSAPALRARRAVEVVENSDAAMAHLA